MCQCPEWGDLHFYLESFPVMKALLMSVNALKGATSISTSKRNKGEMNFVYVSMP